ncbi:MAG TPA: hypothetical protein VMP01_11945 [Pirellulaceae bacterium]|nr:hypothetical protein [Pirellulaceae bacterium]
MLHKLLEWITGKDDVERVACLGDARRLDAYLKARPLYIPQRPHRLLDASKLTTAELLEQRQKDAEDLARDQFEPWILVVNGKRRLPAFSSEKKMAAFAAKISQEMNVIFSLGCILAPLGEVTRQADIDLVDLNLYSAESWEIGVKQPQAA